jgi:hypothetical protein
MITRIHWTAEERDRVLKRALMYLQQGNYSYLDSIRRAQDYELMSNRHRAFNTSSGATDLIKELRSQMAQGIISPKEVVTPIVEEKIQPGPLEAHPAPTTTIDDLVNTIAQKVAATLGAAIREQLTREVQQLEHNFSIPKHNPAYAIDHVSKKRIVVIGLLGDQVHAMLKEFGGVYDLKFIDTDRAMGMSPPDADAYLLMKNFINHPLYHKYRSFPNHVLIDGGMSTLRMWLNTKGSML